MLNYNDQDAILRNKSLLVSDTRQLTNKLLNVGEGKIYKEILATIEKPMIESVLTYTGFNISNAAQLLGIHRHTLKSKMRRYNIK